jgi:hypothetical protein
MRISSAWENGSSSFVKRIDPLYQAIEQLADAVPEREIAASRFSRR